MLSLPRERGKTAFRRNYYRALRAKSALFKNVAEFSIQFGISSEGACEEIAGNVGMMVHGNSG